MSRAAEAYEALASAMEHNRPRCADNPRFIADDLTQTDVNELGQICDVCPLVDFCSGYASIERPKVGVWAGKRYRTYQPRKGESDVV